MEQELEDLLDAAMDAAAEAALHVDPAEPFLDHEAFAEPADGPAAPAAVPPSVAAPVALVLVEIASLAEVPEDIMATVSAACAARVHGLRQDLTYAYSLAARHSTEPIETHGLSLVEHLIRSADSATETQVCYVYWTNATARRGRILSIDASNRIVCIVPMSHPERFFVEAEILVARIPARMLRLIREEMPPWCNQVRVHRQAQSFAGPLHLEWGRLCCVLCEALRAHTTFDASAFESFICGQCAGKWHRECSAWLGRRDGYAGDKTGGDGEQFTCCECCRLG